MKTQSIVLILSSILLASVALNSGATLFSPTYSAQDYFNSMNLTQQNFESRLSILSGQIAEIDAIIKDKNKTTNIKITSMSEKIADQRNSLYDIEQFLKIPNNLRLCQYPILSKEQTQELQGKVLQVNSSIASLETNLSQCPVQTCTDRKYFEQQIKNMKAYLATINQILNSGCRPKGYQYQDEKITGIVDLSNSLYKDNLKAKNWYYGSITQTDYKLRMFELTTKFNVSTCPLDKPFADTHLNQCTRCEEPNAIYNLGVRACLYCGKLAFLNLTTSLCQTCQPQHFYNFTIKECQSCNYDQFLNVTAQQCQYCPKGQFMDSSTNTCASCPPNTMYEKAKKICRPCNTTAAQYYSSTSKRCQNCQSGYRYNSQKLVCELCANNSLYDKNTGGCVPCNTNQYLNLGTMKCTVCSNGTYYNQTLNMCALCPDGTKFDSVLQKCIGNFQQVCPEDHPIYNAAQKRCEACPVGQIYISSQQKCVQNNNIGYCPADKPFYNIRTYGCEACPAGTVFNPSHYGCDPVTSHHRHRLQI